MKRFLSLVLSAALTASLGLPAAAASESGTDRRLEAVTAKVKAALELDTSAYTDFTGELEEGILIPVWNLRWEGEGNSLHIQAEEDGSVLSLRRYDQTAQSEESGGPKLPARTRAEAEEIAAAFVGKLGLEVKFREDTDPVRVGQAQHRIWGVLLHEGLPTQAGVSLTVRISDGAVTHFSRDSFGAKHVGGFPSALPKTTPVKAKTELLSTLKVKLEYVTGEAGDEAVLRYLPVYGDTFYVDGQSGDLVDLTALYEKMAENGEMYAGGAPSASEDAMKYMALDRAGLSQAELEGAAKLAGAMDKDALDKAARAVSALGLAKYTLASVSYFVGETAEGESTSVSAHMTYSKQVGQSIWRRTVTLDAKTGALESVYSSIPYEENRSVKTSSAQARVKAEAFLNDQTGTEFGKTGLYSHDDATKENFMSDHALRYVRQENGYFYPAQSISVSVDASDGSIASYSKSWGEELPFQSPEGIVGEKEALAAYLNACGVTLSYLSVPTYLDPSQPQWRPLIENGYGYLYSYKLAYALTDERACLGVDAKSGTTLTRQAEETPGLRYGDLEGHWAKEMVETLAAYGVGLFGDSFLPDRTITQVELLALLASVQEEPHDLNKADEVDWVYSYAYTQGLLTPAQRQDSAPVNRGELTRMMVTLAGMAPAAKLTGIWSTDFADQADIPSSLLGYAAIAQGLGLVSGDAAGGFAADREANRAEAAAMLYRLMER